MCYHVNQDEEQMQLHFADEFKSKLLNSAEQSKMDAYHLSGFAHPRLWVLTNDQAELQQMEWGLVPFWVKSAEQAMDISDKTLNAKAETVFQLPSFRAAVLKRRCIVPVAGFYEWRHHNKKAYPYFVYPKEEKYFRIGGIWEEWLDKESGELRRTCSVITTEANPLMEQIHNTKKRMPLVLDKSSAGRWLSNDISKEEIQEIMLPCSHELMNYHSISKLITSRTESSNVREVILREEYAELPEMIVN